MLHILWTVVAKSNFEFLPNFWHFFFAFYTAIISSRTGRFEYSPDITSLASSKSSSVAEWNKVVWRSFFFAFSFTMTLTAFDMTVHLTPLDGKSATDRIKQFDLSKRFVELILAVSRNLGFIPFSRSLTSFLCREIQISSIFWFLWIRDLFYFSSEIIFGYFYFCRKKNFPVFNASKNLVRNMTWHTANEMQQSDSLWKIRVESNG